MGKNPHDALNIYHMTFSALQSSLPFLTQSTPPTSIHPSTPSISSTINPLKLIPFLTSPLPPPNQAKMPQGALKKHTVKTRSVSSFVPSFVSFVVFFFLSLIFFWSCLYFFLAFLSIFTDERTNGCNEKSCCGGFLGFFGGIENEDDNWVE